MVADVSADVCRVGEFVDVVFRSVVTFVTELLDVDLHPVSDSFDLKDGVIETILWTVRARKSNGEIANRWIREELTATFVADVPIIVIPLDAIMARYRGMA